MDVQDRLDEVEEDKREIINMYTSYHSVEEISDKLQHDPYHIYKKLTEWDVNKYDKYVNKFFRIPTPKRKELLGEYYDRFVLVYLHEYTYKEASEELDIEVGTVKSGLNRAKKKLDEYYE